MLMTRMLKVLEFLVQCAPQVSPVLMHALVRRESAFQPFAIGPDSGEAAVQQPKTLLQAVQTARELKAAGKKFSVGLAQIHMRNVESQGLTWEQAFQPCNNLRLGQTILQNFYRTAIKDGYQGIDAIWAALRGYNSGSVHKTISDKYAQAIFIDMQSRLGDVAGTRTTPASRQPEFSWLTQALAPEKPSTPPTAARPASQEMPEGETPDVFQKVLEQEGL